MRKPHVTTPGSDTFFVHLDESNDGTMSGVVDGMSMPAPYKFNSLSNLIIKVDDQLDQQEDALQPIVKCVDAAIDPTFELEVLFRQNHSWQGRVRWNNGQKEATFKSVLELLVIMETFFGN